jgi:hypothetical protein
VVYSSTSPYDHCKINGGLLCDRSTLPDLLHILVAGSIEVVPCWLFPSQLALSVTAQHKTINAALHLAQQQGIHTVQKCCWLDARQLLNAFAFHAFVGCCIGSPALCRMQAWISQLQLSNVLLNC